MKDKDIELKISEAFQQDVGYGRARIDHQTRMGLDLSIGDVIEIEGAKKSAAVVWRAHPTDEGKGIIRIDNLTRKNCGAGLGDKVRIRRAEVKEAKEVTLAPLISKGQQIQFGRGIDKLIKKGLLKRPLAKGDNVIIPGIALFGSSLPFMIINTKPDGLVSINEETNILVKEEAVKDVEVEGPRVSYEDIGGLHEEIQKVREMIELPLKHPELFDVLGIDPPKGVLLHGPPGTGKTLIAKAVANESGANFDIINGPEIMSKFYGQSEENLRKKFEEAEKNAPSIIFLDEIDAIAPKRSEVHGEVERRVVSQLLTLMDGLKGRGKLIVIGATNLPDTLDPALRRPGRFDREIRIDAPDRKGRKEILQIHTRGMPINSDLKELYGGQINDEILPEILTKIVKKLSVNDILKVVTDSRNKDNKEILTDYIKIKFKGQKNELPNEIFEELAKIIAEEIANLLPIDISEIQEEPTVEQNIKERLKIIHENPSEILVKLSKEIILNQIADITYGYVGADLAALARESAMNALGRYLPEIDLEKPIPTDVLEKMEVTMEDFKTAHRGIEPSAMREFVIEVPKITWEDVGGLENAKQNLQEAVEWPLKYPNMFERLGIEPPNGILLYGPPGTGKTLLAQAVANESKANFISIKGPEVVSKYVGETEKAIRELFKKARQVAPTIVFLDEMDSITPHRGRYGGDSASHSAESVVNQLLTSIDGMESMEGVVVMGATNRPDLIDPGLLRPGRFDRLIYIGPPDLESRKKILEIHTRSIPISYTKTDIEKLEKEFKDEKIEILQSGLNAKGANDEKDKQAKKISIDFSKLSDKDKFLYALAKKTQGYSGADLKALCQEAAMLVMREDVTSNKVQIKHFYEAMKSVRPSITREKIEEYNQIVGKIESGGVAKKGEEVDGIEIT